MNNNYRSFDNYLASQEKVKSIVYELNRLQLPIQCEQNMTNFVTLSMMTEEIIQLSAE